MQEIACAPKVTLVLGMETLDWDRIARFLDSGDYPDVYHGPFHHNDYDAYINRVLGRVQIIQHQREIFHKIKDGHESKLLDVLARFRLAKAINPRDKIYGLLGLATDTLGVKVDYNKSSREVCMDLFQTYVNTTQDLDLLCQSP